MNRGKTYRKAILLRKKQCISYFGMTGFRNNIFYFFNSIINKQSGKFAIFEYNRTSRYFGISCNSCKIESLLIGQGCVSVNTNQ